MESLRGVGPRLAGRLAKLGVCRVEDLLFHLPLRYEDRTRVTPIGRLRPGDRAVIDARVQLAETVQRRRRTLVCRVADGSGMLTLRFFYFSRVQGLLWQRGARVVCYGEVRPGVNGPEMVHPEFRMVAADSPAPLEQRLTPVYPATEGVSQARLRGLVREALALAEAASAWTVCRRFWCRRTAACRWARRWRRCTDRHGTPIPPRSRPGATRPSDDWRSRSWWRTS